MENWVSFANPLGDTEESRGFCKFSSSWKGHAAILTSLCLGAEEGKGERQQGSRTPKVPYRMSDSGPLTSGPINEKVTVREA